MDQQECENNMIQIDDYDLPIQVAEKIITGTKNAPATILDKVACKVLVGQEIAETVNRDMFELEEIKEIADYLMIYYQAHINGD